MKARRQLFVVVVATLIAGLPSLTRVVTGQIAFESPAFSDPNLLASIFTPVRTRPSADAQVRLVERESQFGRGHHEFHLPRQAIPTSWEEFDKQFAPEQPSNKPTLHLLENGMYQANQMIYSVKLFERNVNSLLNFEWNLHEISGYDSRSKANELDNLFDHAKVKTDLNWDAPVGLYVGVRFQIKCHSIFQFWR